MREDKKIGKHQDLRQEISKLWDAQTTAVPIIFGALGTITHRLTYFLAMIEVSPFARISTYSEKGDRH